MNTIRPRVKAWREAGYPGVTGVTKKLLEHWNDRDARQYQFFFCQQDAIETLIWLAAEAPDAQIKWGLIYPVMVGHFAVSVTKLCTGGGKTTVMAMLIAWQVCNKVTYPRTNVFLRIFSSSHPALRSGDVWRCCRPAATTIITRFSVVPGLMDKLRQGKVIINNWQALAWDSEEELAKKKGVDKRGAKSDGIYQRSVSDMAGASNILVINDGTPCVEEKRN